MVFSCDISYHLLINHNVINSIKLIPLGTEGIHCWSKGVNAPSHRSRIDSIPLIHCNTLKLRKFIHAVPLTIKQSIITESTK